MTFEFATSARIVFGCGKAGELPAVCAGFGRRVLLVHGRDGSRGAAVSEGLAKAGLEVNTFSVTGEPDLEMVGRGSAAAIASGAELVVGLGGGAVVDAGKAMAAMAKQPGELLDYLEVVGKGRALDELPLPFIAVPTTAGTGAEVTRNAVIGVPEQRVKVSLRHASMLPRVALVDPELAVSLPPGQTAASGMDALTQLLEPWVCLRSNPMTDALCREGIPRVVRALETAVEDGSNMTAREDLAVGALFSGMALANAGLGAVHGFAAPIGGMFPAPHGAVCAALLACVWRANLKRVAADGLNSQQDRFREAARMMTGDPDASAEAGAMFLEDLTRKLGIPRLGRYGIGVEDLAEIAGKAARASSMKANPVPLSVAELVDILHEAL